MKTQTTDSVRNAPKYDGSFDTITDGHAFGWALDRANPSERVSVELLDADQVVAVGVADIPREDLAKSGVGDGRCGFRIAVPLGVYDGQAHRIVGRIQGSPVEISGSPKLVQENLQKDRTEVLGLDGGNLKLRIRRGATAPMADLTYVVWETGIAIAEHVVQAIAPSAQREIFIPLPRAILDGRVHVFEIRLKQPDQPVAHTALVTPFVTTSEEALQAYGARIPAQLSPSAALRYESLARQMALLPNLRGSADVKRIIDQLHRAHEQVRRGFSTPLQDVSPLTFPKVAKPRVSVVIPVHDKRDVTYNCLASLVLAPNAATFEVIVVDDGSKDETTELPEIVEGVTFLRNETAQGFVHSCNKGGKAAKGEYVVMLNNDTEVSAGWLDEMLYVFEHFENVGLAGAKLLYPDGKLQEAGGIIWRNGSAWNYGRGGNANDPRYNYAREIDYISGACIMLPRALWNELGGFDPEFAPGYYEDTDLAFRVRAKGYKTIYTPFSKVIHFEGMSSGTSLAAGMKRFQAVNEPKFRGRWAEAIRTQVRTSDPDIAKDSRVTLRCAMIDLQMPKPDRDGGSYAAVQEMRLLQALGFKVTFIPQDAAYAGRYTEALQRDGVECVYAPFMDSVENVIRTRGAEFDLFYVMRYSVAARYLELIRSVAPSAKIVLNNADLHFLREIRAAIAQGDDKLKAQALQTRDAELAVMRGVDLALSYTDTERAVVLSHNLDSTRTAKCPWVVEVPASVPGFSERDGIAFLGNFRHPPNAEAVQFFVSRVMPLLRRRIPGIVLRIYGSDLPESIAALASDSVEPIGYVEKTASAYDACRVFVAPLQSGAGIKGKVIDAFAHGAACVLSPVAAEGIQLSEGVEALVADTPESWVQGIASVYESDRTWNAMSQAARALAARQYSRERGLGLMREALEQAGIYASVSGS